MIAIKRHLLISSLILLFFPIIAAAQPSAVKKAARAIVKIDTYQADGKAVGSGYGVIISEEGVALTSWTPYNGAAKAVATDMEGRTYNVDCIYGASEIYNVARVRLLATGKKASFPTAEIAAEQQTKGSETWAAVRTSSNNAPTFKKFAPMNVETFSTGLPYYIFEQESPFVTQEMNGCPILSAQGKVLGLINTSTTRTDFYAASAQYAMGLTPSALSSNDNVMRFTGVRAALPEDYSEAVVALLMARRYSKENYERTIDDFIRLFPKKDDGYTTKAEWLTALDKTAEAEEEINKALTQTEKADNLHFSFSKIIYNYCLSRTDSVSTTWTLSKSLTEIDEAIKINPLPLYRVHKGRVLYAEGNYKDALTEFNDVNNGGSMRDADVYYYAYQCLKQMKAKRAELIVPLDSATAIAPERIQYQAEKALLLIRMNRAEDAVKTCQYITEIAPNYSEGHGLLGLALCFAGKKAEGTEELLTARRLGYQKADEYIALYGEKK